MTEERLMADSTITWAKPNPPAFAGVIVVEGPDCSGKSTLCNQLAELSGGKVIHMTYRFKNNMFEYNTAVLKQAWELSQTQLVILDRCYLSEIVYAKVFRNGGQWPLIDRLIEPVLQRLDYMGIYCDPFDGDVDSQVQAHAKQKDEAHAYEDEGYRKVVEQYSFQLSLLPQFKSWFRYNYHEDTAEGMLNRFLLRRHSRLSLPQLDHPKNLTGDLRKARLLLIGEQANSKYRQKVLWPFHEYANSSLWLHRRLEHACIPADRVCFMNAIVDGVDQTPDLYKVLTSSPAWALPLGAAAERVLEKAASRTLAAKVIPQALWLRHPQYVKRFEGAMGSNEYEKTLMNAYAHTFLGGVDLQTRGKRL